VILLPITIFSPFGDNAVNRIAPLLIRRRAPEGTIPVNVVEFGDVELSVGKGSTVDMAELVGASEGTNACSVFCELERFVVSLEESIVEVCSVPAVEHDEIRTARASTMSQ
jgi:hypothetical protein